MLEVIVPWPCILEGKLVAGPEKFDAALWRRGWELAVRLGFPRFVGSSWTSCFEWSFAEALDFWSWSWFSGCVGWVGCVEYAGIGDGSR